MRCIRKLVLRTLVFAGISLCADAHAQEIPVRQEILGPWHYLVPLELSSPGYPSPKYPRQLFAPTVVVFAQGARTAAIMPGSSLVAEFREGKFVSLKWPPLFLPLSLAADSSGTLCCLFRKRTHATDDWADGPRWLTFLDQHGGGWTTSIQIPLPSDDQSHCDHIEFDSRHRLWALGPCGKVAVLAHGKWDTYSYSDDKRLGFAPIRLAESPEGEIRLFANWQGNSQMSQMKGILLYQAGKFTRDLTTSPEIFRAAEKQKEASLAADNFDRATGYVCRQTGSMNARVGDPKTVLKTGEYTIVSLANDGLVWTRNADLSGVTPLSEDNEWERIDDVMMAPATDPTGVIWLGRDNPARLIRVGPTRTDEFLSPLVAKSRHDFTLFDQLGRPWLLGGHWRDETGDVVIFDHGFHDYAGLPEALRAHAAEFKAGNIFAEVREKDRYGSGPGVLKTTRGEICLGGPQTEKFTILDGDKTLQFAPDEIKPDQAEPTSGHGYNAFSNGEPREDANGDVTTCVDNIVYRYHAGQWIRVGEYTEPSGGNPPPDAVPDDALATQFKSSDGRTFIFRGFHFYEMKDQGAVQIDFGLNPLAFYPFWKGWYGSPGMTHPRLDPTGRIWISSIGPYSGGKAPFREDTSWQILRQPIPNQK